MTTRVWCFLFAASILTAGAVSAQVPSSERRALTAFYNATGGDGWANREGWLDPAGTECGWFGVICNDSGGHVIEIVLESNGLDGTLPPELADLTFLEGLWLGRLDDVSEPNRLHDEIPPELGSLEHLQGLSLWANQLSGGIPPELGNLGSLLILDLDENPLTGTLPAELGNLSSLEQMWIGGTQLGGAIPDELGQLSELQVLNLWGNHLTGGIPPALGDLANLRYLLLGWNPLGGPIPPELGELQQLEILHLWECGLSGGIPVELGRLERITDLIAGENALTGPIPPALGSLTGLRRLVLRGNMLNDGIPTELGALEHLEELRLAWNALDGEIPPSFGELTALRHLGLAGNQLSGGIPAELGGLENLEFLFLHVNRLSGPIPVEIGNLGSLQVLDLSWNHLEGELPATLGSLGNLLGMDLSSNRIEGALPASLGRLGGLAYLHLRGNRLTGLVPESYGALAGLLDGEGLDIRWNALFTDSLSLSDFLDSKQLDGDWWSTQTLPPFEVAMGGVGLDAAEIIWSPVLYSWDDGGFRVWLSEQPGSGYVLHGITDDKVTHSMVLEGLQPDTTYYAVVQTVTHANEINQSTVESVPSDQASFTTGKTSDCRLSCAASAPATAEVGVSVTFSGTVQASNCEDVAAVRWSFGDGAGADGESAVHAYDSTGTYTWTLTATSGEVVCSKSATIGIFEPQTECGNGICELGESAWTCDSDCGFGDEETGRAGASSAKSAVPAAVGGISGVGGTYWVSEAMIHNPGDRDATLSLRFTADDGSGGALTAGPFTLASGEAAFFENLVQDLFSVSSNGSVIIDSDRALMVVSRTFNDQPGGSYGQFLGAVGSNRIFGVGDVAYLVGLSENDDFRTNVIVQEVAGRTTTVTLRVYDDTGDLLGTRNLTVPAMTKRQDRLLGLGFEDLSHGYATVEASAGGKIVTIASVVDQGTGDAMTVDAVHTSQVLLSGADTEAKSSLAMDFSWAPRNPVVGERVYFTNQSTTNATSWSWSFGDGDSSTEEHPEHVFTTTGTFPVTLAASSSDLGMSFVTKAVTVTSEPEEASRYLVAVVAHLPGSSSTQWRSDLWVLNPMTGSQTVRMDYRPETGIGLYSNELIVPSGAQVAVEDVLDQLFSEAGDGKGSLKIQTPEGVIVSSRTYNLSADGTFGQAIPALGGGDMIAVGESATLLKLKNTATTRCNMGFAEFDGLDTRLRVKIFAVGDTGVQELASKAYAVSAGLVRQVNQIFSDMNVSGAHEAAFATVEVISGGTIYAYASNVDVRTGDAEFIPAMKE